MERVGVQRVERVVVVRALVRVVPPQGEAQTRKEGRRAGQGVAQEMVGRQQWQLEEQEEEQVGEPRRRRGLWDVTRSAEQS